MAETETMDAATEAAMAEFGLRPEPSIVPDRLMPPAFLTHRGEVAKPYSPTLQDRFGKALRDLGLARSTVNGLVGSTGLGREGPMAGNSMSDFSPLGLLWAGEEFVRTGDTLAAIGMLPGGAPVKAGVKQAAGTAADAATQVMRGGQRGPIRVFQGSPHDWAAERLVRLADGRTEYVVGAPDKLPDVPEGAEVLKDFPFGRPRIAEKMGTGEGAQAYGHGMYVAEREGIARSYRDALATDPRKELNNYLDGIRNFASLDEVTFDVISTGLRQSDYGALRAAAQDDNIVRDIVAVARGSNADGSVTDTAMAAYRRLDRALPKPQGRMYELSINADPDDFLDWDAPFSRQGPKVRQAVEEALGGVQPRAMRAGDYQSRYLMPMSDELAGQRFADFVTADDIYQGNANMGAIREALAADPDRMARIDELRLRYAEEVEPRGADLSGKSEYEGLDAREEVAEKLQQAGVVGIKYRDAISRGDSAAEGTRNYVIFPGNEHLIEVLRKYGIIGLLGTGAAASLADGGTGQAQAATMPAYQTGGGF